MLNVAIGNLDNESRGIGKAYSDIATDKNDMPNFKNELLQFLNQLDKGEQDKLCDQLTDFVNTFHYYYNRSFLYNLNVDIENWKYLRVHKTTDWQVSKNLIEQRDIYNEV